MRIFEYNGSLVYGTIIKKDSWNGEDKEYYYSITGPVKVGNKEFVTVPDFEIETNIDRCSFKTYIPEGYRYPTKEEFAELCRKHPFFELGIKDPASQYFIFINDLGLSINVHKYIDNWSGCIYGPLCICQESLDRELKEKAAKSWHTYIEESYDIRARKYKPWFDYRVTRHLIFVKDLD